MEQDFRIKVESLSNQLRVQEADYANRLRVQEAVNASLTAKIRDLEIQLADYHHIKVEHNEMTHYFKEDNDRKVAEANIVVQTGLSGTKRALPSFVKRAKTGTDMNQSIYSNRLVGDLNVSRQNAHLVNIGTESIAKSYTQVLPTHEYLAADVNTTPEHNFVL